MITPKFANHFAEEWIDSWNSHDLERILSHYTDDFTIETPYAAIVIPESEGKLNGKEAIRAYWTIGLQRNPDLKFELIEVLIGVAGITLYYHSLSRNKKVAEVFWLNDEDKVYKTFAYYSE